MFERERDQYTGLEDTPWTDFPGGFGGFKPPPGSGKPPPENVETPPKNLETPPEILLIFNIPNYSLDYFTTMKLF